VLSLQNVTVKRSGNYLTPNKMKKSAQRDANTACWL